MILAALAILGLLLALAAFGVFAWRRRRRSAARVPRVKRQHILPGGGPVPEDLAKDAYTDDQRFLM